MDAIIKVTRGEKDVRIDFDTLTPLGDVWTMRAVYDAILQATMDIPPMSFAIKDGSDRYYKALSESLEKRINSVRNSLPNIEIIVEEI